MHNRIVALALLAPALCMAQDPSGTFSVVIENDAFGVGSDRNYTNGIVVNLLSGADDVPDWTRELARFMPLVDGDETLRRGIGIGHSIFTPADTLATVPPPDQHPYAGWLYGSLTLLSEDRRRLNTIQINVGVVGPAAQGEFVQNNFHRLIGAPEARGWDFQLDNEPGVEILLERKYRALLQTDFLGLDFEATPVTSIALGNVSTYGAAGLSLRMGEQLLGDFGPPRVRPALGGAAFFRKLDVFNWYLFVGAEARGVARNIFLDGNSFSDDSPSVEKKRFVADAQAGLALQIGGVQVAFTRVWRSRQFQTQESADQFGAVSVLVKY